MKSVQQRSPGEVDVVLLVDDNPVNLQILYKTLQGCGYELLTAKDGESALEIATRVKPSLILLDIIMPGMDGYNVCELLKMNPETEGIAVIFLSALEDSSAKVKGFAVGGVDYVSKPFQADEVVARVRNHMKIHRLERQLAKRNIELESENQQILNSISEGIIGLDYKGRVTMLNPAAVAITGWSASDCLGEQLTALGLFDSSDSYRITEHQTTPYRSYHLGQSGYSDMEMIKRKDAKLVPVALSSTPRAEGGAVVVLRSISEWVDSEEALRLAREELESQRQHLAHMERLSTTGEMAAGIAHEVNQPLTAISNYSRVAKRLLEDGLLDTGKFAEILDKLNVQAARASDVIKRIRSFVKKPDDSVIAIDANMVIEEVIALVEVDSRINDVSVHFEPQLDMPMLLIDVVQIEQVALNLIRNAMESMVAANNRQQGVLVTTELKDGMIVFQVIDYGVGVSTEAGPHIFAPFFTTKSNGMGIGLSICQSIVLAHRGKIGFYNNANEGTTFYFCLPI